MITAINTDWISTQCPQCKKTNVRSIIKAALALKPTPYKLSPGDNLVLGLDYCDSIEIIFNKDDFKDFSNVSAEELCKKINSVSSNIAVVKDNVVILGSYTIGANSRLRILKGSAIESLGLEVDEIKPLILGQKALNEDFPPNYDVIKLGKCTCNGIAFVQRTFDDMPEIMHKSYAFWNRCVVNTLAEYLKQNNCIHPSLQSYYQNEEVKYLNIFSSLDEVPALTV